MRRKSANQATTASFKKYRDRFAYFVELEREAEMKAHRDEIRKRSPEARQKSGKALLHCRGKDAGRGIGGTCLVRFTPEDKLPELEMTTGDLIIATPRPKPSGKEPTGTITAITPFSVTAAFNTRPPEWIYKKGLRIDLYINDITYQRMLEALKLAGKHDTLPYLLTGKMKIEELTQDSPDIADISDKLNADQRKAVENVMLHPSCHLVHGPPGTGKTTTIAEIIAHHARKGDKVIATSDSNTAVDNLLEKLLKLEVSAVRTGHPARTSEELQEHTLDHKVQYEPAYKKAEALRVKIDQLRDDQKGLTPANGQNRRGLRDEQIRKLGEKGKSMRGIPGKIIAEMKEWLNIQEDINALVKKAQDMEQEAVRNILGKADVICATNSGAGNDMIRDYLIAGPGMFDLAVVDEATQSTEPAALIPMVRSRRFCLAGDHKQLPPTVLNPDAAEHLQFTLFEKLLNYYGESIKSLLTIQYRMNKSIMACPSRKFYDNVLVADSSVADHTLEEICTNKKTLFRQETPYQNALHPASSVVFLDTSYADEAGEVQSKGSHSFSNTFEIDVVKALVEGLKNAGLNKQQIGIISPYDAQVQKLKASIGTFAEIKTVDGFQGREKEVVIISFVRNNKQGRLGFLSDLRRLNVAISRARRKLVMVGCASHLRNNETYNDLVREAKVIEV